MVQPQDFGGAVAGAPAWREREKTIHLAGRPIPFFVPAKNDPRLVEIAALAVAALVRISIVRQSLSVLQLLVALSVPVVLDMGLTYARRRVLITPASGLITGLIAILMMRTSYVWPFAAVGALAILAKHLLRTPERLAAGLRSRHVFNPSALGLAVVLLAFPFVAHPGTEQWNSASFWSIVFVGIGGMVATTRAKMWTVFGPFLGIYAMLYTLTILAPHGLHTLIFEPKPTLARAHDTLLAARYGAFIFALYLLTEPRTAPRARKGKQVYAALIGIVAVVLTTLGMDRVVGLLVALLLANALAAFVLDPRLPVEETTKSDLPGPLRLGNHIVMLLFRQFGRREPAVAAGGAGAGMGGVSPAGTGESIPAGAMGAGAASGSGGRVQHAPTATSVASSGGAADTMLMPSLTQASTYAYLLVRGSTATRPLLSTAETTVGRTWDNAIRLDAPGVSRHHATFTRRGGAILLTDLGSLNGTFVNGKKVVAPVQIRDGDEINFGGPDVGNWATFHVGISYEL